MKRSCGSNKVTLATGGASNQGLCRKQSKHVLLELRFSLMPLLYKLALHRTKTVLYKMGPVCFYQISSCFPKNVHRIYLFQENQVPVDNAMRLQLGRKMYARTF